MQMPSLVGCIKNAALSSRTPGRRKLAEAAGSGNSMTEAADPGRARRALPGAGASGDTAFLDLRDGVFHCVKDEEGGGVPRLIVPYDFEDG